MDIDKTEMMRALTAFFQPGDVFEIRVLEASTPEYRKPHIESGYFDFEHIDKVFDALRHIQAYRGIYVTANPVDPDLLSRAVYRVRFPGRDATTADSDIMLRRWLLIDCDAKRKSGIPSSEEEHNAALAKAHEIRDGLSSLNWPLPIMTDSGNGAQLMYRVDVPTEDAGLIQSVIKEIALASSEAVDVDLTVFNPARIWRLPGTMNCKGDFTERRPHRMARIIDLPELTVVPTEKLQAIIQPQPEMPTAVPITSEYFNPHPFDLDTWIREHCPELVGKECQWKDGRKWIFDVCPFNANHTNKSAVLMQLANGAISFRCHHNGCSGHDWRALRELREPGYSEPRSILPDPDPDVDLSGFMVKEQEQEEPEIPDIQIDDNKSHPWRSIKSEDVRRAIAGTMLGELTDIYASVTNPVLPLEAALLKAIVTLGCCLSGEASTEELNRRCGGNLGSAMLTGIHRAKLKINTGGGQGNNIYAILAGNSASGKDIGNLLDDFANFPNPSAKESRGGRRGDYLIGTGGSAEGIAEALGAKPNGLILISELRDWLDENHWQHNATSFLTQAFNKAKFSVTFSSRSGRNGNRYSDYCLPSIFASVQPQTFKRMARISDIETGFLGRFLFAIMPRFFGDAACFDAPKLLGRIKEITDIFAKKHGVVEVPQDYTKTLKAIFIRNNDERLDATWRRLTNEYYPRFAVQLSVTMETKTQGETVILTEDSWARARVLTQWFFANAERLLRQISEDSPFVREREERFKKIYQVIQRLYTKKNAGVIMQDISRSGIRFNNILTTAKERQEAIMELMERGIIKAQNVEGKKLSRYVPVPEKAPEGWNVEG